MKQAFILVLIFGCAACTSSRLCTSNKKYLKSDIDTNKPYKLKGAYCIANIQDTVIYEKGCLVKFNVFDRINGKAIENGVVWFYGSDTLKILFSKDINSKVIKAGKYSIEAWDVGYIGTRTKTFELGKNKKIDINFYLGTTVEF